MTKILLICHDIPSLSVGATLPIYHLIKQLGSKHEIHLILFDSEKYSLDSIKDKLSTTNTLKIPEYHSLKNQLKYTLKNMICLDNLKTHSFLNYYYKSSMSHLINRKVDAENFDIVITDMPMAFYAKNIKIPKIVYAFDAVSNYNYNMYKKADTLFSRIYWYLNYYKIHRYERIYNLFDSCIVVNKKDKTLLERDVDISINVIPNGVDTNFFKNKNQTRSKLVFLGDMSTPPNNDAVKYFVDTIYPLVLEKRDVEFIIVGRNPSDYIKSLDKNPHITVTGSVDDVREYLKYGIIFITPMISGTGIKNKILEAMSMNLPVISTSKGISGICAVDNRDYLNADNEIEFNDAIIKLLDNKKLYKYIADNGHALVEKKYSWTTSMNKLDDIITKIVENKKS